jgi:hypothetical protein
MRFPIYLSNLLAAVRLAFKRGKRPLGITIGLCCACGSLVSSAAANATQSPVWRVSALATPTSFLNADTPRCQKAYYDCDGYSAVITNIGDKSSSGPIRITLSMTPSGPTGVFLNSTGGAELVGEGGVTPCAVVLESEVTCESSTAVRPGGVLGMRARVRLGSGLSGMATGKFTVEGGGAATADGEASAPIDTNVTPGIDDFRFEALNDEGREDTQAGDHPAMLLDEVGVSSVLEKDPQQEQVQPLMGIEEPRSIAVETPVGFLGDPQVTPTCAPSALVEGEYESRCPTDTQIGGFAFVGFGQLEINRTAGAGGLYPIYNLTSEKGYPAEFGINYKDHPVILYASVVWRDGIYKLRVMAPSIPRLSRSVWLMTEFFGQPRSEAFLTNSMDCAQGSTGANAEVLSWTDPEHPTTKSAAVGDRVEGCGLLQFAPSLEVSSESTRADEPTGYAVKLRTPEPLNQSPVLATPELKRVTVQMPLGTTLSPSAAYGLTGCQPQGPEGIDIGDEYVGEDNMEHLEAGHCPSSSRIGTAEIRTPLLSAPLVGSVFLREPECGVGGAPVCSQADAEDGKLLGLYVEVAGSGAILKLEGTATVNTHTGQVTTTFANNPQFPASEITIDLNGGPDASLTNPQSCGVATSTSEVEPWSAPFTSTATPTSSFSVDWDGKGGACPGTPPFAPTLAAGTTSSMAGGYSPFTLTLRREDREQNILSLTNTLPPGLLAAVSHVAQCPEPEASSVLGGCPAASKVGTTTVAVGSGSHPYYVTGEVFFTGPYDDAPFGLSVLVPASAGPFNLGNVVVRVALFVNPNTAQVTAVSSELPQMIDGVPLQTRVIAITLNAPRFTLNPTNCTPMNIDTSVNSTLGDVADVSAPFTATGCKNLPFTPKFTASTAGKASKADGTSLTVRVASGAGQANIGKVAVALPKQLPSRLTTLQQACISKVFESNPAACPTASAVGMATAVTPILAHPLIGPAYLVSHGGVAFPDLEVVLQGEGIKLVLDGKTDIKNGITSSAFNAVPDAPIDTFTLTLPAGPYSLLGTNLPVGAKYSLCGQGLAMPTTITGQNGAVIKQSTQITAGGCKPTISITRVALKGSSLRVTVRTSRSGRVKVMGRGLRTMTTRKLAEGTHTVAVVLTKTGRAERKHKRKVAFKVMLIAGKSTVSARKTFKF